MKAFDNLSPLGTVIVILGVLPFIIGCILIASQIPDAIGNFRITSGITSFDFNQMKEMMLNPVVTGAFSWLGIGLGLIGAAAHFQKDDTIENEKCIES